MAMAIGTRVITITLETRKKRGREERGGVSSYGAGSLAERRGGHGDDDVRSPTTGSDRRDRLERRERRERELGSDVVCWENE